MAAEGSYHFSKKEEGKKNRKKRKKKKKALLSQPTEWSMSRFCEEKYSFGRSAATDQKEDFFEANPKGLTLTAAAERATFAALFYF